MDSKLLDILACPLCKAKLEFDRERQLLICRAERLVFPVRDGIPILLADEARNLE